MMVETLFLWVALYHFIFGYHTTSLVIATVKEILLLMLRSRNLVIVMEGKTTDLAFTAQPNMLKD